MFGRRLHFVALAVVFAILRCSVEINFIKGRGKMHEHGNMNIEQNTSSYNAFAKLFTWGTVLCVIIAAVVVMVIT